MAATLAALATALKLALSAYIVVSVSCVRGLDGEVDCVTGIVQDITERRRTEVALRSAKVENEKLIGELRSALQSVKTLSGHLPTTPAECAGSAPRRTTPNSFRRPVLRW
jgi:signal transduction histidine kinase